MESNESQMTQDIVQESIPTPPADPVEEAATRFTVLLPYVKKLGAAMPSQKGLIRVLHAFVEFPLGVSKPKLLTEGERQLFHVLQELQGAKSTVIQDILKKNYELEQLKQKAVSTTAENEVKSESSENQV